MSLRRSLMLLCTLFLGACDNGVQLNVVIYDACDWPLLEKVQHIQLSVEGNDIPTVSAAWKATEKGGNIPLVPFTGAGIVSVLGSLDAGGRPGEPMVAGSVGFVDLSGDTGDSLVEIGIALGPVEQFMRTTNTAFDGQCSLMAAPRRAHTATTLKDGRVFIVGGVRPNPLENTVTYWDTTEFYDPLSGNFLRGPGMGWKRQGHTATLLQDGRVLISGGVGLFDDDDSSATPPIEDTLSVALLFDPQANSFSETFNRERRAEHSATLLSDGTVLVAGGVLARRASATTEIFDPRENSWRAGPMLNRARASHRAVLVADTVVALVGGSADNGPVGTIEFVDVGRFISVDGPVLGTPRSHVVAEKVTGQNVLFVAGGFSTAITAPEDVEGSSVVDTIDLVELNPANWSASRVICDTQSLSQPRAAASSAILTDGRILVAGGVLSEASVAESVDAITIANAGTCTILVTPIKEGLAFARAGMQLSTLAGGDILVTGGFGIDAGNAIALAEGEIFVQPRVAAPVDTPDKPGGLPTR